MGVPLGCRRTDGQSQPVTYHNGAKTSHKQILRETQYTTMATKVEETKKPSGSSGRGRGGRGGRGRGRGRSKGRGRSQGRGRGPAKKQHNNNDKNDNNGSKKKDQKKSRDDNNNITSNKGEENVDKGVNPRKDKKALKNQQDNNIDKGGAKKGNAKEKSTGAQQKQSSATSSVSSPSTPPNQPQQTSNLQYGKGETITVLHVAEKPSIAQAIAHGLASSSSSSSSSSRSSSSLPVHEFTNPPFPKAPQANKCRHRVTSVAGHVFSIDFAPQYQSWDSVDPAELFDATVVRKPCKSSVVRHLQDQARGVDFIVLWMDCDREGENINFEVLDCCMHLMKSSSSNSGAAGSNFDRVYRAYFSAINPSDILKAYKALGKPDKNQALSVDARQELDLKVGVAFSRFQTRYFQGRYGDLDSAVLSYGPCQTPTLGFCVQRHIDIETFSPQPYWVLELGLRKRGGVYRALWNSGRSFQHNKVLGLKERAVEEATEDGAPPPAAVVQNVVIKEKKQGRPTPLNTVAMMKACSKALGIGPHSAMQIAERLYLSGYLSYPRTESSAYPKSFDIPGTLSQQVGDNRWGNYVRNLLAVGPTKARGGVDMGDHPPITPVREGVGLSGDMARVFDLVVRHFIASVSPDAVWRSTRVDFHIERLGDKGGFTLRGKELVSPGFLEILLHKEYRDDEKRHGDDDDDDEEDEEERTIPEFVKGEIIPLATSSSTSNSTKVTVMSSRDVARATLEVKEKMTTPPTYLTESELIGMMEKNGIGTDASISTHIENVLKRNYVTLESGRRLVPSKLGLVLGQGYHQIDSSLVLPQVRSDIEGQCNKIAKGLATRDDVVRRALELFKGKFDVFVNKINTMDVLFSSSFAKLADVGKPFTRCGLTRRYLQYIPGPPQRLYNKWTETVYPLPAGGIIKQWTGRVCPVQDCNFELCLYSVGQPQRTFPLCPRCFNSEEWAPIDKDEDVAGKDPSDREDEMKERQIKRLAGKSLTLECPLKDNHPLIDELTVSPDPDSDGVLMLDPHLGPKWRLVSTRAPTIVHLPQVIEKITVLDRRDDVLNVHMMKVEFKPGQSPLPDGELKHVCCFPTDEVLQGLARVYHGSDRLKAGARGGRGRGRGGRGGRGRGRGGRGRR